MSQEGTTRVIVANDHVGLKIKEEIFRAVRDAACEVLDLGADSTESSDYPVFAAKAIQALLSGEASLAILACGSGAGMAICANRFPGIYAVVCNGAEEARKARKHGNINVLCLAAIPGFPFVVRSTVQAFLETPFAGGRHERRLRQIDELSS